MLGEATKKVRKFRENRANLYIFSYWPFTGKRYWHIHVKEVSARRKINGQIDDGPVLIPLNPRYRKISFKTITSDILRPSTCVTIGFTIIKI